MIEDKNSLIEKAEYKLEKAKKLVKENSALFDECIEYHDMWVNGKENRSAQLYISDNYVGYVGVNLHCDLNKDDSMDDFNIFLDEIPYEIIGCDEYIDGNWIRYIFDTNPGQLTVFCCYENSKHCKLVETGETKPIYKRVCV